MKRSIKTKIVALSMVGAFAISSISTASAVYEYKLLNNGAQSAAASQISMLDGIFSKSLSSNI